MSKMNIWVFLKCLYMYIPGIVSIFIRKCDVKWGNQVSDYFLIRKGVWHEAVASPTFFNICLDDLFKIFTMGFWDRQMTAPS